MKSYSAGIWPDTFMGVENGREAFCGPHTVQIDLTDKCNNACIGCWIHSPLLNRKKFLPKRQRQIPFDLVKKLINELYELGTREIFLAGSGEPFIYPDICKVIKLIKSKGIHLNIITNATLLNETISALLVDLGVDLITCSIWAGSAGTYSATHPGKSAAEFKKIKEDLKRIAFYKQHYNSLFPHVKIYNVICAVNYADIEAMADFAREVDADSLEFQVIDTIKGKTDHLAIHNDQKKCLLDQIKRIRNRDDMVFYNPEGINPTAEDFSEKKFIREEFIELGKIWKNYKTGFMLNPNAEELRCPRGKKGERVDISHRWLDEITLLDTFRYKFRFDIGCNACPTKETCFENTLEENTFEVKLLNIINASTFLRRVFSYLRDRKDYDQKVTTIPCYIGWYYARILTNGNVIPCCKASSHPLGNIYRKSFSKIWGSHAYKRFRFNAKNLSKDNPYFSKINCRKSCDNWGMNLNIHRKHKEYMEQQSTDNQRIIKAGDFTEGNLNPTFHNFGKDLVVDGGAKKGFARYEFTVDDIDDYKFCSRYASGESRPVKIYIDGHLLKKNGLANVTNGWTSQFLRWHKEFDVRLKHGKHILEIRSHQCVPHMEKFAFFNKRELPDFLVDNEEKRTYLNAFSRHVSQIGLKNAVVKAAYNLTPKSLKNRYLEILGIYDGRYGYKGPFHVQIDLTNDCNNQCIACWCNSPLLKEKKMSGEAKKQYLPLELVKELINEISQMGATEIYYSGSGEPFMHPQIMEILEYGKRKGLISQVNTNFTLLDKNRLDHLIDLGVDFLTVSVWAGTAETYCKVHPGRTEEDFYKIKEAILYLNRKKKGKFNKPSVRIYQVIFNMNYFEIEEMIKFAEETFSESIEFAVADTIPDKTDVLKLNEKQRQELFAICKGVKKRLTNDFDLPKLPSGLTLVWFNQFLRRISMDKDVKEAKYDRNVIDRLPCYIGWLFSRVIPNGEVHSCLKAHRIPTGSLYSNRFSEIWNSKKQVHFRKKTLVSRKNDPFFRYIGNDPNSKETGCYKSCDDLGRNLWMHNRLKMMSMPEKIGLKGISQIMKASRNFHSKIEDYEDYHKDPVIAGILHGRKAFTGPEQVLIDPTNACNLRCIPCWLYSPLLKADKPSTTWIKKELPKDKLIRLIDDLVSLGTKRVCFSGGGEPFMHKGLMEVIEYASKKNLIVEMTTNFGLVSKKDIKRLANLGLRELCISICASNAKIYCDTHPQTASLYFEKLKENLLYLKDIKEDSLHTTFANVVMNINCKDFENMYEFGLEYGADALYFTMVDIFPGQTDNLLPSENERKELLQKGLLIKERSKKDKMEMRFYDGFLRRLSNSQKVFEKGEYDKLYINSIPCYVGNIFCRILADGSVIPCCRAVYKSMGNINNDPFRNIWFSTRYNEFRAKAKYLPKTDPYFKEIGCIKECDNLMHNEQMVDRVPKLD